MIDSKFLFLNFQCKFGENKNHFCLVPSEFDKVTIVLWELDNIEYDNKSINFSTLRLKYSSKYLFFTKKFIKHNMIICLFLLN